MKLSCLFGVVMCFGVGAIMALPINDESFETSDTDPYQKKISIHRVPQNSLMDNTWKIDENGKTAWHFKPNAYDSSKYSQYDKFGYNTAVKEIADSPDVINENVSIIKNITEIINPSYAGGFTSENIVENISIATNISETNIPDAIDIPLNNSVENAPNVISENISLASNTSETSLPYAIDIPLDYHVNDSLDTVSEDISIPFNISETNLPSLFIPAVEYDMEDALDEVLEKISIINNVSENKLPRAMDIPLEYHADAVFENVSTNTNESETTLPDTIDILREYHERAKLAEPSVEGNQSFTTEFPESENASSATIVTTNESMEDNSGITFNCTNCTDIFKTTTEPKLIGCMCALFTTQHPTENDIPLTSRTFHNVSCEQDVSSEDACNEVCIGVATINNELKDRMVCSFVPYYAYKLKAFLQSKLCEEDGEWTFTGISSPAPICCYMASQITC